MKQAHSVIVGACSWLAGRTGAWIIGLAVAWMAAAPSPMWSQWNGTNPVWTNSNVGVGTTAPSAKLSIGTTGVGTLPTNTQLWISGVATQLSNTTPANRISLGVDCNQDFGMYLGAMYYTDWSMGAVLGTRSGAYDFATIFLKNGSVGIGTTNPQYKLAVNGNIGAQDIIVTNTGWSDYVFQPGYRLPSLSEVNAYIQANHHLPDIPSEAEVKEKGASVGEMQSKLLAKVEELTLHMIQQEKENQGLRERIARLEQGAVGGTTPAAAK
jgi:hypothetical protein